MYIDTHGGRWFKGNLHTHTSRSDGRISPEDCAALYRSRGYDFLSFTDHWKLSDTRRTADGLLLLSGAEYDFGRDVREGIFHVVAVGCGGDPGVTRQDGPRTCIDKIHEAGGLADLAHPAWSMNTVDQLLPFTDADYTEIFNSTSDLPRNCRPDSSLTVDLLAARGIFWKTAAVDDAHWYDGDECRSYIWVRADECSPDALLAAIRKGDFYSSQGPRPEVTLLGGDDGKPAKIRVDVPEEDRAAAIVYHTDAVWTGHRSDSAKDPGTPLTRGEFALTGRETFVRVEVIDRDGRRAWAQTERVRNEE